MRGKLSSVLGNRRGTPEFRDISFLQIVPMLPGSALLLKPSQKSDTFHSFSLTFQFLLNYVDLFFRFWTKCSFFCFLFLMKNHCMLQVTITFSMQISFSPSPSNNSPFPASDSHPSHVRSYCHLQLILTNISKTCLGVLRALKLQ